MGILVLICCDQSAIQSTFLGYGNFAGEFSATVTDRVSSAKQICTLTEIDYSVYKVVNRMDTPSLKAFVSPRSNSRRKPSDHDQTRPTKCHSSKLLQLLDKGSLNQCIRDLQSSLKQECSRIQSKLKSSH